ncbi:MAG: hypothetical protein LBT50_01115 [Prevotellaceae bacterium]|jgi:hypothetical protein|nr:hypothetical protein [Prevotellaceae bacterium]
MIEIKNKFNENPFRRETPVTPFSNGSEYESWDADNCCKCIECGDRTATTEETAECKLEYYISLGSLTGTIPLWVAKGVGCEYNPLYGCIHLYEQCRYKRENDSLPF